MPSETRPGAPADLQVALEAARRAAAVSLSGWGPSRRSLSVEHKGPLELVTEYDRLAEEAARAWIEKQCPHDTLVLEESGVVVHAVTKPGADSLHALRGGSGGIEGGAQKMTMERGASLRRPKAPREQVQSGSRNEGQDRVWYVDPLDGTTNFAHGLPLFCASVGLTVNGRLAAGAVVAPVLEWEFTALSGAGASFNGRPVHVSETADLDEALVVTGMPYHRRNHAGALAHGVEIFIRNAQGVRRLGAAALDLCFVACGWMDAFYETGLKPWDLAAGMLMVEQAGGTVTGWHGQPAAEVLHSGQIAASNGRVHGRLLELLEDVASAF